MGDQDDRRPTQAPTEDVLDERVGHNVHARSGFVEEHDRCFQEERAHQAHELALTSAEVRASFPQLEIKSRFLSTDPTSQSHVV